MQKAFTLDINKCTGCQACEVACAVENELAPGTSWRSVETFNARHHPGLPVFHLSLACNHCTDAPCMEHCPTLAYSKDPATGAVLVDAAACIGCKYCTWACPYDAPRFDDDAGVVTKCTFCNHRLKEGQRPACVEQCPTGALQIAELDAAPGTASSPGFPETGAGPSVRFIPLRGERPYPHATAPAAGAARLEPAPPSKVSLGGEWPLVVFTLLTAVLAGAMATPAGRARLDAVVFIAAAALAAGFSTMHLGRRMRAYRAVLNWRRSWLSREIILFSLFAAVSALCLLFGRGLAMGWAAAALGTATLVAMDGVYGVTHTRALWRHSARALLTGAFVATLVAGSAAAIAVVGGLKLLLYVGRKIGRRRRGLETRAAASAARVAALTASLAMIATGTAVWNPLVAGLVALGEIVDRCEFYLELDVPTPRGQMARDLAAALATRRAA